MAAAEEALAIAGAGGYLEWCDSLWAATERNRVARLVKRVALALAQLYGEGGRREDAIAVCRQAIALDPLDEEPRRTLIRHLVVAGQAQEAQREYASYCRLVREELEVEPSPELRALAAAQPAPTVVPIYGH
jgi:two-component SAPR family response regulator